MRVIKAYRYDKLEWSCRFGGQNWCVRHRECGLLDHKDADSVTGAVARIHAAFLDVQYPMVFGILLGDRGTEFSDPESLESFAEGGRVFYCDPGKPGQKGGIERNHVEMRKVLVKGVSFDNLTQEDQDLVLSHVNSYPRMELGLKEIPVDRINLMPALVPDIARQVVERAKRIGDEEEIARKAVEKFHMTRGERTACHVSDRT